MFPTIEQLKCDLGTPSNARRSMWDKINELIILSNLITDQMNQQAQGGYTPPCDSGIVVDKGVDNFTTYTIDAHIFVNPNDGTVMFWNEEEVLVQMDLTDVWGKIDAGIFVGVRVNLWMFTETESGSNAPILPPAPQFAVFGYQDHIMQIAGDDGNMIEELTFKMGAIEGMPPLSCSIDRNNFFLWFEMGE